jgi:hypothetical protein
MNKFISIWFGGRIAKVFSAALMICSLSHCKGPKAEDVRTEPPAKYVPASSNSSDDKDDENDGSDKANGDERDSNGCAFDDGTHSATIGYYNPSTNYSATYTLDVEVDNCQIIQIDFNNGGYLGPHHIAPADIDEDGDASVVDDRGRSYEVHLDE